MFAMLIFVGLTYLIASLPFGVIITTLWGGDVDIRAAGSGNIGATNAARVYGWGLAGPVMGLDAAKGFLPVLCAQLCWPDLGLWWASVIAVTAFMGHCYSIYLEFRGGKGVATGAGALLAVTPIPTLIAAGVWGAVLAWTGRSSVAALVSAMVLVVVTGMYSFYVVPLVLLIAVGIVVTHLTNIGRLVRGQEATVIQPVRWRRSGSGDEEQIERALQESPGGQGAPLTSVWPDDATDPMYEGAGEE